MSDFTKCTYTKTHKDGRVEVGCVLGLWSVDAPSEEAAISEAAHYFSQYRSDGEYSDIIGGKSAIEVMLSSNDQAINIK